MAEDNSLLHPRSASSGDDDALHPLHSTESDHGVSINLPSDHEGRPLPVTHISAPTYHSPIRHHRRAPSRSKGVKETLDARSQYGSSDDASVHRINQYIIKQEIGRGSFGAVHLATDQYGNEFAVKEFSKSRLRKRAQSNLLRKPNQGRRPGHIAAGLGFNAPLHLGPTGKQNSTDANNSLSLIKEEIAIMKKLNHNNLVALIEVLDDPQEDSLYMVLEMCKKGVAMHVGLDERAEPYDDETCRCWFRDMILGIEYLHAQGIIHRDIKPDNCLITSDDVLKIVDFGVSEMFEKESEMATAKSAGSPAFMPPELCVAKHGQVSGRAADIWSMGVTLYCLRYGHIPFEKASMLELYDSIRADDIPLQEESDANFAELMTRLLEKDPEKRINMEQLRNHPWVTKNGADPLLSAEENTSDLVTPPTEAEMEHAITGNMVHLLAVMKAVKRFKRVVSDKHGRFMDGILGRESKIVAPPQSMPPQPTRSKSQETHNRHPLDKILVTSGIHRDHSGEEELDKTSSDLDRFTLMQSPESDVGLSFQKGATESDEQYRQRMEAASQHASMNERLSAPRARTFPLDGPAKGQAHDPLEDTLFLHIGHDPEVVEPDEDEDCPIVSESPPAVEMNIYEQAYQEEMDRILARRGQEPAVYMTRRVDHREDIRALSNIKDAGKYAARTAAAKFQGISAHGFAAGQGVSDAGRNAARSAAEKISERWYSSSASATTDSQSASTSNPTAESTSDSAPDSTGSRTEAWKQAARDTASRGYGKIGELYNKTGGGQSMVSGLVARVSGKQRGEDGDSTSTNTETSTASAVPPSTTASSAPTAAEEDHPSKPPATEQKEASTKTSSIPSLQSVFKERII